MLGVQDGCCSFCAVFSDLSHYRSFILGPFFAPLRVNSFSANSMTGLKRDNARGAAAYQTLERGDDQMKSFSRPLQGKIRRSEERDMEIRNSEEDVKILATRAAPSDAKPWLFRRNPSLHTGCAGGKTRFRIEVYVSCLLAFIHLAVFVPWLIFPQPSELPRGIFLRTSGRQVPVWAVPNFPSSQGKTRERASRLSIQISKCFHCLEIDSIGHQ